MGEEYRAKVFKSGNSLAIRVPKDLGLKDGTEMRVREEQGRYVFEPAEATPRKIDVSKFVGTAPGLKPLPSTMDDSPRDWHLLDGRTDKS